MEREKECEITDRKKGEERVRKMNLREISLALNGMVDDDQGRCTNISGDPGSNSHVESAECGGKVGP